MSIWTKLGTTTSDGNKMEITGLSLSEYDAIRLIAEGVETDTNGVRPYYIVGTSGGYLTSAGDYYETTGNLEANGTAHADQNEGLGVISTNDNAVAGLSSVATLTHGSVLNLWQQQ